MKDQVKENIVMLYKEYCDYIDAKNYSTSHFKSHLYYFMEWLDKGFLAELED